MSAFPMPDAIESRLDELATEIRKLRVLRGASWFALVLFAIPVAAIAVDSALSLSGWARGSLLAGWVVVGAGAFWWLVWRRMKADIAHAELAEAIEKEFPNLAERLRTIVELSEHCEPGNGSKAMLNVLVQDTLKRTKKLDFFKVAPLGSSLKIAAFAAILGLAAISLLALVPESRERVRRLLLPWYQPPVDVPYALQVASKDQVVKRGDPVTLSAYLERTKPQGELPPTLSLVMRSAESPDEKRLPMPGDDRAAFTITRPAVSADFEYRIESDHIKSDWFRVSAVDPVTVLPGSTMTVVPPEYARVAIPEAKHDRLGEVEALQYSVLKLELKLSHAPKDVHLNWRGSEAKAEFENRNHLVELDPSRTLMTASIPLVADGSLQLTFFGERGLKTDVPLAIRAIPDAAPKFDKVAGMPVELRDIKPDGVLAPKLTVTDDIALGELHLDYSPNNAPADEYRSELLKLPKDGKIYSGDWSFSLAGKVENGQLLRVRLRLKDGRELPKYGLKPNEAIYPPSGWATLRVTDKARPLAEQDVLGQKERFDRTIKDAAALVNEANEHVDELKRMMADKPNLTADQAGQIVQDRVQLRKAQQLLADLAEDAERRTDSTSLARSAREAADGALARADDELRQAMTDPVAKSRDAALEKAHQQLAEAAAKLSDLAKSSDAAAAAQLDRTKLEELAAEQDLLAKKAEAADDDTARKLAAEQERLREKLAELRRQSDAIRRAEKDTERLTAEKFAGDLGDLANATRELDDAAAKASERAKRESIDELKAKQQALKDEAEELKKKTTRAAEIGRTKPLDSEPLADAAAKLERGQPGEALSDQEKAARELERYADELAKAAKDRGDAKKAAEQLQRWQKDLNRRAAEATDKNPGGLKDSERDRLAAEQSAISKATSRLQLPKSEALREDRDATAKKANEAAEQMKRSPSGAGDAMMGAAEALQRLAEKTPSNEKRREAARGELERLQREQQEISKETKQAAAAVERNPDDGPTREELAKSIDAAAKKQAEIEAKLRDLDTPGLEARRDRAAEAAKRAGDDARKGLPQDIPSSQDHIAREMERLHDALEGKSPADEKAGELARLQREQTKNLKAAKPTDDLQRLQRQQEEIARQLSELKTPEAPDQFDEAKKAAQQAERAGQKPTPDLDELRKASERAEAKLDKLAERLNAESPEDRLERLAERRKAEAQRAEQAKGTRDDLTRSSEAKQQAERDRKELQDTRTGDAQGQKKKLDDLLDKIAAQPEPDRAAELQKKAAEAAKQLAETVKKGGRGRNEPGKAKPPSSDPADAGDPGNELPTDADAEKARELAMKQRALSKDSAANAERTAKGETAKPNAGDPLKDRAEQQKEIAKAAEDLSGDAEQRGETEAHKKATEAAAAAKQAAREAESGDADGAKQAGEVAAQKLREAGQAANDGAGKQAAEELAKKQDRLNADAAKTDKGDVQSRLEKRPGELAKQAEAAADKLDKAAAEGEAKDPNSAPFAKAAEAARDAAKAMQQAERDAANGKPNESAKNRREAERKLDEASRMARGPKSGESKESGSSPGERSAAEAAKQAERSMKPSAEQMAKGDSKGAAKEAAKAAEQLKQAATEMAKPESKPAGGLTGKAPGEGQGGPSGPVPNIVFENLGKPWGELPGELKTKIMAELKAKYGEDYARVIKLYFEQLAERK